MTETQSTPPEDEAPPEVPHHERTSSYGGGHIQDRHGRINLWLACVYVIMFAWAIYYGLTHWGGLGPGLDY